MVKITVPRWRPLACQRSSSRSPCSGQDLNTAVNGVVDRLILKRSCHLSRADQLNHASLNAGRSVKGLFNEMSNGRLNFVQDATYETTQA